MSDEKSKIKVISNMEDFNDYKKSHTLVVDFATTRRGSRRNLSQNIEKLAEELSSNDFIFAKCDMDKAKDVATHCGITSKPMIVIFENGEQVREMGGGHPEKLSKLVEEINMSEKH